jgi:hypothetical protein
MMKFSVAIHSVKGIQLMTALDFDCWLVILHQRKLLSMLCRLIKRFSSHRTSDLCSRSNYTITLYLFSAVQYSTTNPLARLGQLYRHHSPPAASPSPSLSLPALIGDVWPLTPSPPPEPLLPVAGSHVQYRKPVRHVRTWPPTIAGAFHSLHS